MKRFWKEEKLWLLFFFCFSLLIRLIGASRVAYSWDEVDFALAVERYDILQMQPHFPGYPILIVLAKLLNGWLQRPVLSLSWISALAGSFSILVFYGLSKNLANRFFDSHRRTWVWIATLLFSFHPALFLSHLQPMSDALGLFFILLLLYMVSGVLETEGTTSSRRVLHTQNRSQLLIIGLGAFVLYGLALGVRVSYFPVGAVLLLPMWKWAALQSAHWARWIAGWLLMIMFGVGAILFWVLPTAATEGGLLAYWKLGESFTEGHFEQWGGTIWSAGNGWSSLGDWLVRQWLFTGLTGNDARSYPLWGWLLLLFIVFMMTAIAGFRMNPNGTGLMRFGPSRISRELMIFVTLWVVPYTGWVLFGQNMDKWRHLLPVYPLLTMFLSLLIIAAGKSISKVRAKKTFIIGCTVLYILGLGGQSAIVLRDYRQTQPVAMLAQYLAQHQLSDDSVVYTWEEQRFLSYYHSDIHAIRLQTYNVFLRSLPDQAPLYNHIYLTNAVIEGFLAQGKGSDLLPYLIEVGRWQNHSLIDAKYSRIVLYELDRQFINLH